MDAWQLIVLAGAVIMVYAYLIPKQTALNEQKNMLQQLEEMFEHFSLELDGENEELLQQIAGMNKEAELQTLKLKDRIGTLEHQTEVLKRDVAAALALAGQFSPPVLTEPLFYEGSGKPRTNNNASLHSELPVAEEEASHSSQLNMKERYSEVIQHHTQGKSMEFIAKKLSMNKGEIQLIIELARQEEQLRV